MDRKKLIDGYKKILLSIYSRKNYYKRINTFIEHYKPTVKSRIKFQDVKAFFWSSVSIGIFSKARFLYWKLLVRTFFTNTKAFPIAVEMAILGLHYEKVSKVAIDL